MKVGQSEAGGALLDLNVWVSSVTKQVLVKKKKKPQTFLPIICEFIHIFIDFCIGYIKRLYLNSNLGKQPIKVPFCRVPP